MPREAIISKYTDTDLDGLKILFASYYRNNDKLLSPLYNRWLYGRNPFASTRTVKVIENGQWIGFMAMIPVLLIRQGMRLAAYYVVNVLVHPQHHGKHVFGRMIGVAKDFVKSAGIVLMGHPNGMALKSWQRAGMHFQDELKPFVVMPGFPAGRSGIRVRDVTDIAELAPTLAPLNEQSLYSQSWRPSLSLQYLNWRYLSHPVFKYRIQLIEQNGDPVGFMVSRRIRPGISLLVDQFLPDWLIVECLGRLPWITIAFLPHTLRQEISRGLLRAPVKKQIPFFSTYYPEPFTPRDVMRLGLSISDF